MRSRLFALATCLTLAASAHAQVLKSNFGPGDSFNAGTSYVIVGTGSFISYQAISVTFVPSATAPLGSVDLGANRNLGTNSYVISLSVDNGGQPGALLESWTTTLPGSGVVTSLTSVVNPLLDSSTTYWLTLEAGAPNAFGGWAFNDQGDTGHFLQSSSGGAWVAQGGTAPVYRINGAGASAPEPGSVALLGLGIAAAGVARWRRA